MQLHQVIRNPSKKRAQRIGRGGKRGSYSGRGVKGQKSRAGRRIRPAVRDLIIRIPKRRGFRNKPLSEEAVVISVGELRKKLAPLQAEKKEFLVTREVLQSVGILPAQFRGRVKILGDGEIDFPIAVQRLPVSASAKGKIEKAGGRIQTNNS